MIDHFVYQLPLQGLTKKSQGFNFRCPLCGDSSKNLSKKRGWILTNRATPRFHCHNCGESMPFFVFLKNNFPDVYKVYLKEYFKKDGFNFDNKPKEEPEEKDIFSTIETLEIPKLSELSKDNPAVQYFIKRKFPKKYLSQFHYAEDFRGWIHSICPDKFVDNDFIEKRLVIPHYDQYGKIFCVQGRDLSDYSNLRYITIKFTDHPKVFGLQNIRLDHKIFVLEGAFDSLFLPNAIAMSGADLSTDYLKSLTNVDNFIFVFDNEKRNPEMLRRIEKVLNEGFNVCLLPEKMKTYGKDINAMVINGFKPKEIYDTVMNNIFCGKRGLINLKLWCKTKF
jgi:transcription elongation factor Elf1